jgi:hypothetical protein
MSTTVTSPVAQITLPYQGMFSGICCTTQELFIMKMLDLSGTALLQVASK